MEVSARVAASEIADMLDNSEEVFLPGLGCGYVIEAENDVDCVAFEGRYNVSLGTFTVLTFHNQDGDEEYTLLSPDTMVEVGNG